MRTRRWVTAALVGGALTATGLTAAPAGAATAPAEGSFVETPNGRVFRIVGGAPLRVSSWAVFGGKQRTTGLATLDDLSSYPRDGTFVRASDGRAYRFAGGAPFYISAWSAFGGPQRTILIDAADITNAGAPPDSGYPSVRAWSYDLLGDGLHVPLQPASPLPLNGNLYVRGIQTGRVYKMVGGAPVWVPSWSAYGGPKPYVNVDQAAIDHAGQAGPWRFVRKYPADGWVVQGAQTGEAYVVAGGGIVYVGTRDFLQLPNVSPPQERWLPAKVDQRVIDHAGGPAPYDNLLFTPAVGTNLTGQPPGGDQTNPWQTYEVFDGVLAVPDQFGPNPVTVDQAAFDHAGEGGVWSHLPPLGCAPPSAESSARRC